MKTIKIKILRLGVNISLIFIMMLFLGNYISEILLSIVYSGTDIRLIFAGLMLIAMFVYLGLLPLLFMIEYYLHDKNLIIKINEEEKTILYKNTNKDIMFKFDDISSYSIYHYVRVPAGYSKIKLLSGEIIYISFLVPLDNYILKNKHKFSNLVIYNSSKFFLRIPSRG